MAMNGNNLASEVVTALDSAGQLATLDAADKTQMSIDMRPMMNAIIDHFKANAEIFNISTNNSGTVTMPIGSIVTTGTAATQSNTPASIGSNSGTGAQSGTGKIQ